MIKQGILKSYAPGRPASPTGPRAPSEPGEPIEEKVRQHDQLYFVLKILFFTWRARETRLTWKTFWSWNT